jgi:putative spermidine/putrescine transport system substrate-binding protein
MYFSGREQVSGMWKAGVAVLVLVGAAGAARAQDSVTIVSWGGTTQDAMRQAWWDPIAKQLGITIKEDTLSSNADVRVQVESGNVTWDIVDMGSAGCVQLERQGLLEPLDYSIIDTTGIDPKMVSPYWVGQYTFSTLLAWNKEAPTPSGWADFWNVKDFPGPRSLHGESIGNLEYALLADGVPPDQLYPLDLDRAFKKLEEIKPYITVWWESGAQSVQLATSGEVDYISMWNARASVAVEQGGDVDFTFNQGLLDFDCLLIPKGAPNAALAQKVIAGIVSPDLQANFPALIPYGPVNALAFETGKVAPADAARSASSPDNAKVQVVLDPTWWYEHGAEAEERFQAFIQN